MSPVARLVSDLVDDARQANVLAALFVGLITGTNMIIIGNALGTIVFSGQLEPFRSSGIGLFLFSMSVVCLLIALTSGYRGAISAPPTATAIAMMAIATTIEARGDALFVTALATLAISSAATGLCFLAIGHFRLANLMQFIPYPVAGGFLAGTGAILCLAGLSMMRVPLDWKSLAQLFDPLALWNWVPGIAFAAGLLVATKRWKHILLLPLSFVGAALLFHLGLMLSGISMEEARSASLFFVGTSEAGLWPPPVLSELNRIDATALAMQVPNIITLILITLICVVMNTGGLEQIANIELDWNREFKSTGLASLLSGIGGGPPGCQLVAVTVRSRMFGAETWLTGAFAALLVGCALFLGDGLIKTIPVPLTAGIVIFTGFSMLNVWFSKNRRRLPTEDFCIVLLILVIIVFFGFLEGVGTGMLVTLVVFAVRLSRLDLIEATFSLRERRSTKSRSIPERALLWHEGERAQVYRLRGHIFFGSAYRLVARLKQALNGHPRPVSILLDFGAVTGFDLSAVSALSRFIQNAHACGAQTVLSAAPEGMREGLRRSLPRGEFDRLCCSADLDQGLEHCEEHIISTQEPDPSTEGGGAHNSLLEIVADDLELRLNRLAAFEELTAELRPWLERHEYEAGAALVMLGKTQREMQLLVAGKTSTRNAKGERLFQSGPGDILEPRGAFGDYTAQVTTIADERCTTLLLTPSAQRALGQDAPQLALKLWRYVLTAESPAEL